MANLPTFTFFLDFISLGFKEFFDIEEPQGYDASNFVILQNQNRFSRDIARASDKLDLKFIKGEFSLGEKEQVISPDGTISKYLTHGLDWILESEKQFGYESKIAFGVKKNGIPFTIGLLDSPKRKSNLFDYYSCAIIQNNAQADYKRHLEDTIDLFGTKNYLNETITPVETIDFLRKAVPINQNSVWKNKEGSETSIFRLERKTVLGNDVTDTFEQIGNNCIVLEEYGIENSLTFFDTVSAATNGIPNINTFKYIKAKRTTTNLQIDISELTIFCQATKTKTAFGEYPTSGTAKAKLIIKKGINLNTSETIVLQEINIPFPSSFASDLFYFSENLSVTIPILLIGESIWIYPVCEATAVFPVNSIGSTFSCSASMLSMNIKASAISTAIDTIIRGVRYFYGIKQTSKYVKNLPVVAPRFDASGEFYDQVIWNRSLISQKTDNKFNTSLKEMMGSVEEVCADYEFLEDKIFIGQYQDYHVNEEIAVLPINVSKEFTTDFAENAQLNTFKFGYETYEQERTTKNTKEDIHTDSEWGILNENVENKKEIKCKLVRSAYSQQVAVDLEISNNSTSDTNDDKVYIAEIIPLAPSSFNVFGAILNQRLNGDKLEILNRDSEGDNDSVVINWLILGLNVGQNFQIISGSNVGTYTIFSITKTVLSLTPVTGTTGTLGDVYSEFKFFYTNILWKTRGNEGFTSVTGLNNPANYPNLRFSIRRNIKHWEAYINRSTTYIKDRLVIVNRYFKNNTSVATNYNNEGLLVEKGDISITDPILSPYEHSLELVANYEEILSLLETMKVTRGFIRCYSTYGMVLKGFIKKLDYVWKTGALKVTIDEKFESKVILVNYVNKELIIGGVNYGLKTWWEVNGDYIQFYDEKSRPIINFTYFNFISLNGVTFTTSVQLVTALNLIAND